MIKYIVKPQIKRQLAKDYLKRHENISSSLWKKIKRYEHFWVNGQPIRPSQAFVQSGDTIEYEIPVNNKVIPVNLPLSIIYEDDYLLIVDKPSGMLTHPLTFEAEQTLANAVMYHYNKTGQNCGCHPLYRLDRNTSGIVIFAKVPQLQYQLANHHDKLQRFYYALVAGKFDTKQAAVDAPIGRQEHSIILHKVCAEGKHALTHYRVVKEFSTYSLLELWLETGRTHQIRVHMAYINHPLLGDDLYGGHRCLIDRHALHAYKVKFTHPFTGENLIFESKLPPDMQSLI